MKKSVYLLLLCMSIYTIYSSNNEVFSWGRNIFGRLGYAVTPERHKPIQTGTGTNWISIADEYDYGILLSRVAPMPVAICKDITIVLDDNGFAEITGNDVDNGSYSYNGGATLSVSPNTFSCADVGTDSVTLTVSDNNNITATCSSIVTIEDNTAPIVLTQDIELILSNGQASISPSDVDNGSSDACGINSMSVSPNIFDCSMIGDNVVTLTVTDNNGNTNSNTAIVTVVGEIPTVSISVNPDYPVNPGGNYRTIYIGYGPQSVILTASGGTTYSWTSDPAGFTSNAQNPTVSPTETTTYYVEATNDYGCTATESVTIYVQDISSKNGKVNVCHNDNNWHTLCISENAVPAHLAHGDYLGSCNINGKFSTEEDEIGTQSATLAFSPNPLSNTAQFTLEVFMPEVINIYIVDVFGKAIANLMNEQKTAGTYTFDFDASDLLPGVYYCHLMVGNEITTMKLVIVR